MQDSVEIISETYKFVAGDEVGKLASGNKKKLNCFSALQNIQFLLLFFPPFSGAN
jgi:hypothetical protein